MNSRLDSPQAQADRLDALGRLLRDRHALWSHRPFAEMPAPWEREHPEVAHWLRGLAPDACDALHAEPQRLLEVPNELARWCHEARALTQVPATVATLRATSRPARVGVRKWAQVSALAQTLAPQLPPRCDVWMDWCAGKGHLGRTLAAATQRPVLFVERRAALCNEALRQAHEQGVAASAVATDVLSEPPRPPANAAIAALHACGSLGDAALVAAVEHHAPFVASSPCCYHFQPEHARHQAWSEIGRSLGLALDTSTLRFATAEEVVATPRRHRRRKRAEAFRLGLDVLLRRASGVDRYTRVPPLPAGVLDGPFDTFVRTAAERHRLTLPRHFDADDAEREGWVLAELAAKLSLVRVVFRRALELWLVLDRALWLGSCGFDVEVTTFCAPSTSPRNLLIVGRLRDAEA